MAKVTHEFDLYGKHYVLEAGELAKQATGACVVKCGDSTVLLTAVVSKERKDYDFFPLTVDFIEKMYAVGRIPGGYLKREARPSEKATLIARMIDRPLRPSFPEGFRNEVQVVATSLVADQINAVDTISVMGASAALHIGGVPYEGPLACVRIGRNSETGEFLVNPTYEERDHSDLDLELAGSATFISMLEAGAHEISEEDMLSAMAFGQEAIAAFCEEQKKFFEKWEAVNGPIEKREYILDEPIPEVHERIFAHYDEMSAALKDADKQSRMAKVADLMETIKAEFNEEEQEEWSRAIAVELKSLEKHAMRVMVVETGERVDGRAADEIRRVFSSAVKRRFSPSALLVCSMNGSVLIPLNPLMASATSTITTSHRSAPEKPAAWEAPSVVRSVMVLLQSEPCSPLFPPRTSSLTQFAWSRRSWSPTVLLQWLLPADRRLPLWMPVCRWCAPSPVLPWVLSRRMARRLS